MTTEIFVYSRIGMALISAQRVEFISKSLLEHLTEFDANVYKITTNEFLSQSNKSKKAIKTLGNIFKLLELNPSLIIEEELNNYLEKRNVLVHNFWEKYLPENSDQQMTRAIDFCIDFGMHSEKISKFFQGFVYYLIHLNISKNGLIDPNPEKWRDEFEYFTKSLKKRRLE